MQLKFSGRFVLSEHNDGDSILQYIPAFYNEQESGDLFRWLSQNIPWAAKIVRVRGKWFEQPRMIAYYGQFPYTYNELHLPACEMPQTILDVKHKLEQTTGYTFNSVLLNLYKDAYSGVNLHRDDEQSLVKDAPIASISLGQTRRFFIRKIRSKLQHQMMLEGGSLLLLLGSTNRYYLHGIPKEAREKLAPRINLTFRTVKQVN